MYSVRQRRPELVLDVAEALRSEGDRDFYDMYMEFIFEYAQLEEAQMEELKTQNASRPHPLDGVWTMKKVCV